MYQHQISIFPLRGWVFPLFSLPLECVPRYTRPGGGSGANNKAQNPLILHYTQHGQGVGPTFAPKRRLGLLRLVAAWGSGLLVCGLSFLSFPSSQIWGKFPILIIGYSYLHFHSHPQFNQHRCLSTPPPDCDLPSTGPWARLPQTPPARGRLGGVPAFPPLLIITEKKKKN